MSRLRDAAGDVGPALAAELLSRGREVLLRARGSSMGPLVQDGDVLTLAPPSRSPRAGELVAALSAGRLLVHRVVQVRAAEARLQGDALWDADGWFAFGPLERAPERRPQIIGRAVALRRGDRLLGRWRLAGPLARLWLALLPLVRLERGARRRLGSRISLPR